MKETGLMFKAPLVRSILDGSKTQTRRLVKPAPARDQVLRLITPPSGTPYAFSNERIDSQNLRRIRWDCQAGGPGDRIYVRETFCYQWSDERGWLDECWFRATTPDVEHPDGGEKSPWENDGTAEPVYTAAQVLAMLEHRGRGDDENSAQSRMDASFHRGHGLPSGWQPVPVEPTEEQLAAVRQKPHPANPNGWDVNHRRIYREMLAAAPQPPTAQEHAYICPVRTVADLVNNLLLMDQTLPIHGAQYIEHPAGRRRVITVPPTVSRERVKDRRWIGEGEEVNAAVIWTRAEQPTVQKLKPLTNEQIEELHGEANRGFDIGHDEYFKAFRDGERAHGITDTP